MIKIIKYIFSNCKIYIQILISITLTFIFSSFFVDQIQLETTKFKTLNSSDCHFVAYDDWNEESNCYKFYNNNVNVYIENADDLLNIYILEFVKTNKYDNYSLINPNNVIEGNYSILKENEIAVSSRFASQNKITIGDFLYIESESCLVKFIYNDIYQIHKFDSESNIFTILVGSNTVSNEDFLYCKFNPTVETHHTNLYNINHTKAKILSSLKIYKLLLCLITFFVYLILIVLIKFKNETLMLKKSKLSGERHIFIKSLIIESVFLLSFLTVFILISFWNKYNILIQLVTISNLTCFLISIILKSLVMFQRRERHG